MLVWYFLINGVKVRPLRCQFPFVQGDPAGLVLRTSGNTLKMLLCLYDSQMIEHDWTNHLESFIVSNFHDIQKVSPMIPFKLLAKSPCPHQLHRTYPSWKLIHHYHITIIMNIYIYIYTVYIYIYIIIYNLPNWFKLSIRNSEKRIPSGSRIPQSDITLRQLMNAAEPRSPQPSPRRCPYHGSGAAAITGLEEGPRKNMK